MKSKMVTVALVAGVFACAGCSGAPDGGTGNASLTGPALPAPTATTDVVAAPTVATTTASPESWVMPDLVGHDLQAAQDAIQALTDNAVFFTTSTDATGQGRAQVVDSNWKVCSQNIRPGEPITSTTKIEFAAVKLAEQCP